MAERFIDTIQAGTDAIRSLAYSPCGNLLLSGGGDCKARVWDLRKHRMVGEYTGKSSIQCVGYSPDGKLWAVMTREGEVRVFDRANESLVLETKFAPNAGFLFTPDSRHLLGTNAQGRVFLFSIQNKNPLYILKHAEHELQSIAVSPDGRYVASGGSDYIIRLYDLQDGKEKSVLEYHKNVITALAFSPDSKTLGSADMGGACMYWDMNKSGSEARKMHFQWATHQIAAAAWTPDGLIFAIAGHDARLKLLEPANSNKRLEDLTGHQRHINCLAFSPCGKFAATGSGDTTIRIWNIKKPHLVA